MDNGGFSLIPTCKKDIAGKYIDRTFNFDEMVEAYKYVDIMRKKGVLSLGLINEFYCHNNFLKNARVQGWLKNKKNYPTYSYNIKSPYFAFLKIVIVNKVRFQPKFFFPPLFL